MIGKRGIMLARLPAYVIGTAVNGHDLRYRVMGMDGYGNVRLSMWDAEHSDETCWCTKGPTTHGTGVSDIPG